jgi:hypothetical protein
MSKKPTTLTERIVGLIETLTVRMNDYAALDARRTEAIENRLAELDGGPDATQARSNAFEALNSARRRAGKAPLGFEIT